VFASCFRPQLIEHEAADLLYLQVWLSKHRSSDGGRAPMLRFTVFRRSWLRRDLEGATGSGVLVVSDDELSKAPDLPRYNAKG